MTKQEIKKLDKIWGIKVHERGQCEKCGSRQYLQAHHFIGRRNRTLRWDLKNGILLCAGCHKMRKDSAHEDPQGFVEWAEEHFGAKWSCYIRIKKNTPFKQSYGEVLENMI